MLLDLRSMQMTVFATSVGEYGSILPHVLSTCTRVRVICQSLYCQRGQRVPDKARQLSAELNFSRIPAIR